MDPTSVSVSSASSASCSAVSLTEPEARSFAMVMAPAVQSPSSAVEPGFFVSATVTALCRAGDAVPPGLPRVAVTVTSPPSRTEPEEVERAMVRTLSTSSTDTLRMGTPS